MVCVCMFKVQFVVSNSKKTKTDKLFLLCIFGVLMNELIFRASTQLKNTVDTSDVLTSVWTRLGLPTERAN